MFSPFRDDQGRPKAIANVTWEDLSQLSELEEGFALEFKQTFGPSVRRKIPKIVASFSNSRGGWLVIGIADDSREVVPVPRGTADVSQVIGELCRRHVSPAPHFEVRFLADPSDDSHGVILVRVDEGDFPPYVADGIVEIREGSTSGPADGTALVDLYDRAASRRLDVRRFCRRTVYYPMADDAADPVALFDLYLFRLGPEEDEANSRASINEGAAAMRAAFECYGIGCRVQHAHDSLVFRTSQRDETVVAHSAIELFPNESMKLSVPAVMVTGEEREQALRALLPTHALLAAARCAPDGRYGHASSCDESGHAARSLRSSAWVVLARVRGSLRARAYGRGYAVVGKRDVPQLRRAARGPLLRDSRLHITHPLSRRRRTRHVPCAPVCRKPLLRGMRLAAWLARPRGRGAG